MGLEWPSRACPSSRCQPHLHARTNACMCVHACMLASHHRDVGRTACSGAAWPLAWAYACTCACMWRTACSGAAWPFGASVTTTVATAERACEMSTCTCAYACAYICVHMWAITRHSGAGDACMQHHGHSHADEMGACTCKCAHAVHVCTCTYTYTHGIYMLCMCACGHAHPHAHVRMCMCA